jgi:hypothetical protein
MDRPGVLHDVDAPGGRIDLIEASGEGADLVPPQQVVVEAIHLGGERIERPDKPLLAVGRPSLVHKGCCDARSRQHPVAGAGWPTVGAHLVQKQHHHLLGVAHGLTQATFEVGDLAGVVGVGLSRWSRRGRRRAGRRCSRRQTPLRR